MHRPLGTLPTSCWELLKPNTVETQTVSFFIISRICSTTYQMYHVSPTAFYSFSTTGYSPFLFTYLCKMCGNQAAKHCKIKTFKLGQNADNLASGVWSKRFMFVCAAVCCSWHEMCKSSVFIKPYCRFPEMFR